MFQNKGVNSSILSIPTTIWISGLIRCKKNSFPSIFRGKKIRFLPERAGERYASALTKMNLNNKIIRLSAKIRLKDYVNNFLIKNV